MEITVTSSEFNGKVEREVTYSERLPTGHYDKVVVRIWLDLDDSLSALNAEALLKARALLLRAIEAHGT